MASRRASGSNTISSCALCEGSNLPSCCVACVNTRLFEYYATLRLRRNLRDTLQFHIVAPRGQGWSVALAVPVLTPPSMRRLGLGRKPVSRGCSCRCRGNLGRYVSTSMVRTPQPPEPFAIAEVREEPPPPRYKSASNLTAQSIIVAYYKNATRSKLRRVSKWIVHTKSTRAENHQQVMSKNWKERIKNDSADFLSISELLPQSKPCNLNIYASIGKIVLMGSLRPELKGHLSVIEKHSLNGHNDIVRDFITTGCKLCGLPLYEKNLHGDSTYPIDCLDNPKYLHVVGQIYKPFMIYVQDQTGQVPVLVKNKVAEILFSNINADDVSECYKSRHCMLVDTCDSGQSSTCGMLDGSGKTGIAKRKRTKHKLDFHLIWLIVMKCLLNQGKNSPFCFQISVNPGRNVEDGRFELISLTMPIP
ncbi:uncharacterized protein LOC123409134 [Hordeum vulgare subsp. vulgare]|uniref:uncharacterized protein LOC123409134 n=1 Tax=Hordeum vulgare subsp. vulgare TaxID=112509 RepID=UPI001D1A56E2|nr:uncharacterized protein LOC123409134 [Hordeum vulgare subsp. vulgare]